jgi:putative transposase
MTFNHDIHHRRSIRLKDYDYSQAGAYFVTICTKDKECMFGDVIDGEMRSNEMGHVVRQCWNAIPEHFPNSVLDEFVVMPNHVHGIIILNVGAKDILPLQHHGTSGTIGSIIRGFKIGITKWARQEAVGAKNISPPRSVWQRNYYEHIIRNEPELNKIREYIINNPLNWEADENYGG